MSCIELIDANFVSLLSLPYITINPLKRGLIVAIDSGDVVVSAGNPVVKVVAIVVVPGGDDEVVEIILEKIEDDTFSGDIFLGLLRKKNNQIKRKTIIIIPKTMMIRFIGSPPSAQV